MEQVEARLQQQHATGQAPAPTAPQAAPRAPREPLPSQSGAEKSSEDSSSEIESKWKREKTESNEGEREKERSTVKVEGLGSRTKARGQCLRKWATNERAVECG